MRPPVRPLLLTVLSALWVSACVKTECPALRAHSEDCGFVAGTPAGKDGGVCEKFRTIKGRAGMESYTSCITKLRCDDKDGLNQCIDKVTNADSPPCDRLTAYLVGCGLEPASGGTSCAEYAGLESTAQFGAYVGCVTEQGCLTEAAAPEALDTCRRKFLGNAEQNLAACEEVASKSEQCGEAQPTLATCMAQSTSFTGESVELWAKCYVAAACGDFLARARCSDQLAIEQDTASAQACRDVGVFQLRCSLSLLPGLGDPNNCSVVLRNFTQESAEEFGSCLVSKNCDDLAGIAGCGQLLQAR